MLLQTLEAVFRALNERNVRYLVAGGVAVNAYGYQRTTQDLDLVVELDRGNILRALDALTELGYRPVLPVEAEEFADSERRKEWHEERNVDVFSLTSDRHPETTVDLFVREPFDVDVVMGRARVVELAPGVEMPLVPIEILIRMKEEAGRPRDRDDVEKLRWIMEDRTREGGP